MGEGWKRSSSVLVTLGLSDPHWDPEKQDSRNNIQRQQGERQVASRLGWDISLSSPQCPTFCCSLRYWHPQPVHPAASGMTTLPWEPGLKATVWAYSSKPWLAGTGQAASWNGNGTACRKVGVAGIRNKRQVYVFLRAWPNSLVPETSRVSTGGLLLLSHLFLLHPVSLLLIGLKGIHQASSHFSYNGNYGHM